MPTLHPECREKYDALMMECVNRRKGGMTKIIRSLAKNLKDNGEIVKNPTQYQCRIKTSSILRSGRTGSNSVSAEIKKRMSGKVLIKPGRMYQRPGVNCSVCSPRSSTGSSGKCRRRKRRKRFDRIVTPPISAASGQYNNSSAQKFSGTVLLWNSPRVFFLLCGSFQCIVPFGSGLNQGVGSAPSGGVFFSSGSGSVSASKSGSGSGPDSEPDPCPSSSAVL